MANRVKSPSEIKGQLQRIQMVAQLIINGFAGKPFRSTASASPCLR